jgi:hypothetical protein
MPSLNDITNEAYDDATQSFRATIVGGLAGGYEVVGLKNSADERIDPATEAKQDDIITALASVPVTGTFWQATQPISVVALPLPTGAATEASQQTDALTNTELRATPVPVSATDLAAINTALQSGGISQTQFAAMVTALQTIDNFISGSRGLVTEDNSAAIKTAVESMETAVKPNALKVLDVTSYDVDASAVLVVDASADATMVAVIITNNGDEDIYLGNTSGVGPLEFIAKLSAGEKWEYPLGYTSDATNDIYAERASAQTNDDVMVTKMAEV